MNAVHNRPDKGRFARFAAQVAELLDIDEGKANALLDGIAVPDNWYDSPIEPIRLYDLEGGPKVQAAIRGFVSMPAGSAFPEHEHLGTEHLVVPAAKKRNEKANGNNAARDDGGRDDEHRPRDGCPLGRSHRLLDRRCVHGTCVHVLRHLVLRFNEWVVHGKQRNVCPERC